VTITIKLHQLLLWVEVHQTVAPHIQLRL